MKTLLALLIIGSVAFAQAPHGTEPQPVKKVLVKKHKKPAVKKAPVVKAEVKK